MRQVGFLASAFALLLGVYASAQQATDNAASRSASGFTLSSPDIAQEQRIGERHVYGGYGCTGENISPALSWTNPPPGTRSLALMVHDPDAPTGSGWWHWIVYDIPANTRSLPANAGDANEKLMPAGAVQARTDFGTPGYGGPCPPPGHGTHRYFFRLHALRVAKLDVPANARPAQINTMVQENTIATAELMATYSR